jgi:hypothetical protein
MSNWYYIRDDKKAGPVPTAQLKELANSGRLRPSDMVWRSGTAQWASADQLKGLFDHQVQRSPATGVGDRQTDKATPNDNLPSPARRR